MFADTLILPQQLLDTKKSKRAARRKAAGAKRPANRASATRRRAASRQEVAHVPMML